MKITWLNKNERIPIEIRTNKDKAKEVLLYIKNNNISFDNNDIYALASWCNIDIDSFNTEDIFSEITSISYIGDENTYDLSIDNGNSFVANGIICHNTVNIPNNSTEELVSKIYKTGWESGCKGITVYRDGSRSGVLIQSKEEKEKEKEKETGIIKNDAPKRPKELPCDVHQLTVKGEKWVVFVGLLENDPYEVFSFKKNGLTLPTSINKGKLLRRKSGVYSFITDDGLELDNVRNYFDRDEQEALTRVVSLSLRHGADVKWVIDQLNKSEGTITSFSKAIARTLKKYLNDKDAPKESTCPSCGDIDGLIYEEGCVKCKSCDYSVC